MAKNPLDLLEGAGSKVLAMVWNWKKCIWRTEKKNLEGTFSVFLILKGDWNDNFFPEHFGDCVLGLAFSY